MLYEKDFEQKDNSRSSIGVIKKWYDEENHLYIKTSSYNPKSKTYHIETVMESIASEIGELLGVNVVKYWLDDLTDLNGDILKVCVSKDYKFELNVTNFIPAKRFLLPMESEIKSREDNYHKIIQRFPHLKTELDQMIIFDYLIDNEDRHLHNFELYTANNEVHLSPLYDNGCSLLSQWTEEDLEDLEDEELKEEVFVFAETRSKCFTLEHSTDLRLVGLESYDGLNLEITKEQFSDIIYSYKEYLSEQRMQMVCELLEKRYNNLLKDYQRKKNIKK